MNSEMTSFQRRYSSQLLIYLRGTQKASGARALGYEAAASGMELLDIARAHEEAIKMTLKDAAKGKTSDLNQRASEFFGVVVATIKKGEAEPRPVAARLRKLMATLHQRTSELSASHLRLQEEIRRKAELKAALSRIERHHHSLLKKSELMKEQLRYLSHQLLSTQEEERRRISRELHDQIVARLTGINIELSSLNREARDMDMRIKERIARAQRIVRDSVDVVHAFAVDLRPTALDDLGLIPALRSFVSTRCRREGLWVRLNVLNALGKLNGERQTVLYRVAQEALTNVLKHAHATRVNLTIKTADDAVSLRIGDNGKSFRTDRLSCRPIGKGLGLLGMRERVEMVGGTFRLQAVPGKGTTVLATVPIENNNGTPKRGS